MVVSVMLRHLLNDDLSLSEYVEGSKVSFTDVKRRLFLKTREAARDIPDHYYRLLQENVFNDKKTIEDLLCLGIYDIAKEYLEIRADIVYVQQNNQNEWQELLTYIPPLILQAAFLHGQKTLRDLRAETINEYYSHYIVPNCRYTALPRPFIPHLQGFSALHGGFHDLHVHLNGTTETDHVWQDHLSYPEVVYKELSKGFSKPKVKEQLEQESHLLKPLKYLNLLHIARRIRQKLFEFIFKQRAESGKQNPELLLYKIVDTTNDVGFNKSPFCRLLYSDDDNAMRVEMLMYILVFRHMQAQPGSIVASLFHFYLLICGLCNRLLVQQTHQHGFEQFQKHTLNGLREFSEKTYAKRFFQMQGNEMNNLAFLEGRFSPQKDRGKNISMMQAIERGWQKLNANLAVGPGFSLVGHFIKGPDNNSSKLIRYKSLRIDLWQRALELRSFIDHGGHYSQSIVGIDAASSEFDTPPEVFGPVFRYMRRTGVLHFTYHAGEDFFHILSGLRSVYEAIVFTELSKGDRIGHCTASGLSVKRWLSIIGEQMLIRRGEWMDTLVFVRHLIKKMNVEELANVVPALESYILKYFKEIFGLQRDVQDIEEAWLCRKYCPMILFNRNDKARARLLDVYDDGEWDQIANANIRVETVEILQLYHSAFFRGKYNEPILINSQEVINENHIEKLQLILLHFMHKNEIIIETLPTSNVRIGHHRNFETYHLWNWFKWEEDGWCIPPIVVGTDDTGIFATNIYNEYANVYCDLIKKVGRDKAMTFIGRLQQNSVLYRFQRR
ncbi:amidohydrolase family protein [Taibaiella soli]|uniref:Adenosine deaminase domain-containing protein n=1 Tax=Taibaiella soli TaxID=1649169 RepID=A0A2W2BKW9_9BACT|nr:hypothetical protein [Taibaiella soli]PZF74126.1 hypothetical protein DN068_03685 [Taibaiella soli]